MAETVTEPADPQVSRLSRDDTLKPRAGVTVRAPEHYQRQVTQSDHLFKTESRPQHIILLVLTK